MYVGSASEHGSNGSFASSVTSLSSASTPPCDSCLLTVIPISPTPRRPWTYNSAANGRATGPSGVSSVIKSVAPSTPTDTSKMPPSVLDSAEDDHRYQQHQYQQQQHQQQQHQQQQHQHQQQECRRHSSAEGGHRYQPLPPSVIGTASLRADSGTAEASTSSSVPAGSAMAAPSAISASSHVARDAIFGETRPRSERRTQSLDRGTCSWADRYRSNSMDGSQHR